MPTPPRVQAEKQDQEQIYVEANFEELACVFLGLPYKSELHRAGDQER